MGTDNETPSAESIREYREGRKRAEAQWREEQARTREGQPPPMFVEGTTTGPAREYDPASLTRDRSLVATPPVGFPRDPSIVPRPMLEPGDDGLYIRFIHGHGDYIFCRTEQPGEDDVVAGPYMLSSYASAVLEGIRVGLGLQSR